MTDEIKITILEDGVISIETPGISMQNHVAADKLINELIRLMGNVDAKKKIAHHHHHHHEHNHEYHRQ